jgi:hypothetical protein
MHPHHEWSAFVEVGNLLAQIRNRHLYRRDFPCFADYCRRKWRYERTYAYRLIHVAEIFNCLLPMGNILPRHERQARPLYARDLSDDQKRAAWLRATELAHGEAPIPQQVQTAVTELNSMTADHKTHPHRKKLALDIQTIKKSILTWVGKAELCVRSGRPDLVHKLLCELKNEWNQP